MTRGLIPGGDRFAIVQTYYHWLSHHHGGQGSREYARLSRMGRYYRPGALEDDAEDRDAYEKLCDRKGCKHPRPETYTAPSAWASYLINGDASGLGDEDVRAADAMVEDIGAGSPVDCEDYGFTWSPDYGEAGDCQTYTFLRVRE